jgi:hypothetical protein
VQPIVTIRLPASFTDDHQRLILKYLVEGRWTLSQAEWRLVLGGFDLLHQALVVTQEGALTFRQVYQAQVDRPFADLYIAELLKLSDVAQGYSSLRARLARAIVKRLQQAGPRWPDLLETNLLLAYCLYFWESFAAGYAFEVEIYRDLTTAGIAFEAHDIRDRDARSSPYDLKILGLRGDIKTSLYFLYVRRSRGLPHDFYVTRFYRGSHRRTLVVMLKPKAWDQIDGETVTALLEEAARAFPTPVMIELEAGTVVIAAYEVWKAKVLRRQQEREGSDDE